MDIRLLHNRIKNFDVISLMPKIIKDLETTITDMNRDQLEAGFDSTGTKISSYHPYADSTIISKAEKGTLTNNNPDIVNLHDEGGFYDGMFLFDMERGIAIDSRDSKTDDLRKAFDDSILGLTKESLIELKPFLSPLLRIGIINKANGKG